MNPSEHGPRPRGQAFPGARSQDDQLPARVGDMLPPARIREQLDAVERAKRELLVCGPPASGADYGLIPRTKTPTLFKAGAEKLCALFQLAPTFQVEAHDLGDEHREYVVRCTLTHRPTGTLVGEGVGSCNTMEKRYRWRYVDGPGGRGDRVPNPDLPDCYNTILKQGKKRALVDAVLTATFSSGSFTQDLDETMGQQDHGGGGGGRGRGRGQQARPAPPKVDEAALTARGRLARAFNALSKAGGYDVQELQASASALCGKAIDNAFQELDAEQMTALAEDLEAVLAKKAGDEQHDQAGAGS